MPAKINPNDIASLLPPELLAEFPELHSPEKLSEALNFLKPRESKQLFGKAVPVLMQEFGKKGADVEREGWAAWLRTLGPKTFTGTFADFHAELWDWYWPITEKRRRKERLTIEELIVLAIWGRGNGKSSHIEWACIAEGALIGEGYVMYCCATEKQARDHVSAIRTRLESTQIAEFYPGLSEPEISKHGFKKGWSQDYLATKSGWGIIPVGLKEGIRGGRQDDMRFSMIVLDDIDDFNDSPAVVENKLNAISRGIIPAGTEDTIILFPQNVIHENSVINQILTRRTDILAVRKVLGPYPTFDELDLVMQDAEDGGRVWSISHCKPHWEAFDVLSAQKFLAKSGRNAFLAEYQHDFESAREGRVLRNYDDSLMVITKADFKRVFGVYDVPDSFNKYVGHDWARTKSAFHANVAGKLGVSGQNTKLPGKLFLYDLMSFEAGTQADDVGLRLLESLCPIVPGTEKTSWRQLIQQSLSREGLEQYVSDTTRLIQARRDVLSRVIPPLVQPVLAKSHYAAFRGSHDQNNDALEVYRRVYGLPFQPLNPGETGGLEWADHYMQVDKNRSHPFFDDEQLTDGTWKLGCPGMFIIVEEHKKPYPRSGTPEALHDSDLCRFQFNNWRMRPAKLSEAGAVEFGPMKMHDDFGQMLQMILFGNIIRAAALSKAELSVVLLPTALQPEAIAAEPDGERRGRLIIAQRIKAQEIAREMNKPKTRSPTRMRQFQLWGR